MGDQKEEARKLLLRKIAEMEEESCICVICADTRCGGAIASYGAACVAEAREQWLAPREPSPELQQAEKVMRTLAKLGATGPTGPTGGTGGTRATGPTGPTGGTKTFPACEVILDELERLRDEIARHEEIGGPLPTSANGKP
jgi:hypothetical protein